MILYHYWLFGYFDIIYQIGDKFSPSVTFKKYNIFSTTNKIFDFLHL